MNLEELYKIIKKRKKQKTKNSYVVELLQKGNDAVLQKIGEEATELIIAAKNKSKKEIIFEASDSLFMILILLSNFNITLDDIYQELEIRNKNKTSRGIQNEENVFQDGGQQE